MRETPRALSAALVRLVLALEIQSLTELFEGLSVGGSDEVLLVDAGRACLVSRVVNLASSNIHAGLTSREWLSVPTLSWVVKGNLLDERSVDEPDD